MVWKNLLNLFSGTKRASRQEHSAAVKSFRKRYARFRKLVDANTALGELMTNMEHKLNGKSLFGSVYLRGSVKSALDLTNRMVLSLQGMRAIQYDGLSEAFEQIAARLHPFLPQQQERAASDSDAGMPLTLDIRDAHAGMIDIVGGKCDNLGEMYARARVPVPRGFAVTLRAFRLFMAHDGLHERITAMLGKIEPEQREDFAKVLSEICALIEAAPLPPELALALEESVTRRFGAEDVRLAVRSSALSEDGDKSFAGQFLSELGVARADLPGSYKRVVASLFTPSATVYRLHQGIPLEDSGMAVACIEMVDAAASGVSYSHDPANLLNESMIISAI